MSSWHQKQARLARVAEKQQRNDAERREAEAKQYAAERSSLLTFIDERSAKAAHQSPVAAAFQSALGGAR